MGRATVAPGTELAAGGSMDLESRVGVMLLEPTVPELLAGVERAEELGVPAAWLISGGLDPDPLTLLAAAAVRTRRIALGTTIVHTFPRHPLVLVQQALVVAALAPGRLRLGVGPSHHGTIEGVFGIPMERPLEHLREYVTVLRAALQAGPFDFAGKRFRVRGRVAEPPGVPVLVSALGPAAFRLAGEVSDGALPALCPLEYLRAEALPALRAGPAAAGRTPPPLLAHCLVVPSTDVRAVRAAARRHFGWAADEPFYQAMFARAGFAEAREGRLSDRIVDAFVVSGSENEVATRLRHYLESGMDGLIVTPIAVGDDHRAERDAVLRLVATL
jgi:F420-dependent oxidoreductase-like protein